MRPKKPETLLKDILICNLNTFKNVPLYLFIIYPFSSSFFPSFFLSSSESEKVNKQLSFLLGFFMRVKSCR